MSIFSMILLRKKRGIQGYVYCVIKIHNFNLIPIEIHIFTGTTTRNQTRKRIFVSRCKRYNEQYTFEYHTFHKCKSTVC